MWNMNKHELITIWICLCSRIMFLIWNSQSYLVSERVSRYPLLLPIMQLVSQLRITENFQHIRHRGMSMLTEAVHWRFEARWGARMNWRGNADFQLLFGFCGDNFGGFPIDCTKVVGYVMEIFGGVSHGWIENDSVLLFIFSTCVHQYDVGVDVQSSWMG